MTSKTLHRLALAGLLSSFLAAAPAAAQFICNAPTEAFSNGIPAGWSVVDNAGNGLLWGGLAVCAEPGNYTGINFTGGLGDAACVSSSVFGAAAFDATLVSPVFSLAGVPSASLVFNTNYQDFIGAADLLDIEISTNGGTTWTTLVRWDEDHGAFRDRPGQQIRIDLSPFLGTSNLRVRWHYYDLTPGALDWYAQVDDAKVRCGVCGALFPDPLADGGFEAGSPSTAWAEASANFGTPLCSPASCGTSGARTGTWWASFGGPIGVTETASLEQTIVLPQGNAWLSFYLWNPESSGNGTDALRVRVDGTQVLSIPAGNSIHMAGYARVVVDLSAYANGGSHAIRFETTTSGSPAASKFFVDDVFLTLCEPVPSMLSVNDATIEEGTFGTKNLTFKVTLSPPSEQEVTVDYATANGTATAGADYVAKTGTLTFPPEEVERTVDVVVNNDALFENDETFHLNLSNPVNAGLADAQGVGTIEDPIPSQLFLNPAAVDEGNTGLTPMTFEVTMAPAADHEVTVVFETIEGGTATPGVDYQPAGPTTITFDPGDTFKTVDVQVIGDVLDEEDEDVLAQISSPTGGATLAVPTNSGYIFNEDRPEITINNVSVLEGDSGTTAAVFTVSLSNPSIRTVTVNAATANGTATAPGDYAAVPSTLLTFTPGQTSKTFTVPVNGDTIDENDEVFYVNLFNAPDADILDPQGVGTILDDDTTITINNVSGFEGNSGTTQLSFTVSLTAPNRRQVSMSWQTANGTATAGSDYVAASGSLFIPAGSLSGTIPVTVNGDTVVEPDETFFVNLSNPVNGTFGDAQGQGTILNDDVSVAISDVTVDEAGTANAIFTVSRTGYLGQAVSVNWATADGTALATTDYVAASGTATIPAGQASTTITVQLRRDDLPELAERFYVNLSAPVNATLADAQGVGTITDDDNSYMAYEAQAGADGCFTMASVWQFYPPDRGAVYPTKPFSLANKFDMTFKVSFGQYDAGGGGLVWLLSRSHALGSEDMGYDYIGTSVGVEMDTTANYLQDPPEDHIAVDENGAACCHRGYPAVQASATSDNIEDGLQHELRVTRNPAANTLDVRFDGSLRLTYYNNITNNIFGGNPNVYWGFTGANNCDSLPCPNNVVSFCPVAVCIGDTATPHVLVDDIQVSESTATTAVFKVRLFCPRSQTVTVNYATANGTALAGSDYVATAGTLTFSPGQTEKTVSVTLIRDGVTEPVETFYLNLSSPSANLATPDTQAAGRIVN